MPGITFSSRGDFKRLEKYLRKLKRADFYKALDDFGQRGVRALSESTPVRTGTTASSWGYTITKSSSGAKLEWTNSNVNRGVNIAVIIQYGHGTGTGGYVTGLDYINPAMRPVFDQIIDDIWKEATTV